MSFNRDVNKKVREQTNEVGVHLIVQLLKSRRYLGQANDWIVSEALLRFRK